MPPLLLAAGLVLASCTGETEAGGERSAPPPPATPAPEVGVAGEGGVPAAGAVRDAADDPSPRVVFLGTSLTAGLGLADPADRWPERLGAMADSAGRPVRVVNAGVSGDTSAGGLRRLDWLLRDSVDILVVELGANDGLRGQSPEALEENLLAIVEQTRERWPHARVVIAGMEAPPNLGPDYTEAFRAVFPRVAQRTDATLVPFLLEGVAGVAELNQADGIHPTPAGHRVIAGTVWPHLDSLLIQPTSPGSTP